MLEHTGQGLPLKTKVRDGLRARARKAALHLETGFQMTLESVVHILGCRIDERIRISKEKA